MPAVPAPAAEGIRVLLFDTQFRAEADSQSYYVRTQSQVLSPQGLSVLGNVGLAWNPASQQVTVHAVTLIRDGQAIDILATQSFETLRREENLEQATLDGVLTASLQPSGLRIGDILDVSYTLVSRDPVIGGHAEQMLELNLSAIVDRIRYRASWPTSRPVRLQASNGWTPLRVRREGGYSFVEVERDAAQPVVVPIDVPGRLRAVNTVELSDYAAWSDIAVALKPLYDHARQLADMSPLKAEIERIRALSDDPAVQAAAALRLVQDEVRYVALLMGDGALTPATADETWIRRFGDCKAKTALLLALLDGLGIEAEPAAVSVGDGDGLAERLPMIAAFNHVLVRARVDGQTYWLDGTRSGDRALAGISVPSFDWALPLTGASAQLERLQAKPLNDPDTETVVEIDASAGLYAPVRISATLSIRGDGAVQLGGAMALLTQEQKEQMVRELWETDFSSTTITQVTSAYDEETNIVTLSMTGSATQSWGTGGVIIPGSTLVRLTTEKRDEGPFHDAPFAIEHPTFTRRRTTLRLPAGGEGFRLTGEAIDRTELGYHARRSVSLEGDTVTIETARRSLVSEITASEAAEAQSAQATRSVDLVRIFRPIDYIVTDADRESLAADTPTTADGWLDRALALAEAEDLQGALRATEEAVKLAPERSDSWANRGIRRYWTGDREGAIADFAKAVDIDPSERVALNGNALIAASEGRHQDAVIELSRALRQVPGDDFALARRAQAYVALGQFDLALRDVDARIAARPDDLALRILRILFLERAGQTDAVDAEIQALKQQHPGDTLVLLNHASILLDRGQAEAASNILFGMETASPDQYFESSMLLLRARSSIALSRLDLAARDFDAIRETNSNDSDTMNSLCWTAAVAGVMLDQALRDCNTALALAPTSAAVIDSRARALLQTGDLSGALNAYDQALSRNPGLAASLYGRGLARIALGQIIEGEADKAAAIEISPRVTDSFKAYPPREPSTAP